MKTSVFVAALSACSLQAAAHSHSVPHSGTPARPFAATYQSAFGGYKPWQEQSLASWKALNDEVHRVGGHVGIFRGDSVHRPSGNVPPASIPENASRGEDPLRVSPRRLPDEIANPEHSHGGHQ